MLKCIFVFCDSIFKSDNQLQKNFALNKYFIYKAIILPWRKTGLCRSDGRCIDPGEADPVQGHCHNGHDELHLDGPVR